MKIIATISTNRYLAEVDIFELRELNRDATIEVGAEFEIRKAAETLAALRSLPRSKLSYMKKQIEDLQKKFNEIEQTYDAVMLLDTIKNSEES